MSGASDVVGLAAPNGLADGGDVTDPGGMAAGGADGPAVVPVPPSHPVATQAITQMASMAFARTRMTPS
jgi:hypothetical protein